VKQTWETTCINFGLKPKKLEIGENQMNRICLSFFHFFFPTFIFSFVLCFFFFLQMNENDCNFVYFLMLGLGLSL